MQLLWIAKGEYSYPLHRNLWGFAFLSGFFAVVRILLSDQTR